MGYILLALFLIIAILCYLEDYIRKYQKSLFFLIGLVLICGRISRNRFGSRFGKLRIYIPELFQEWYGRDD